MRAAARRDLARGVRLVHQAGAVGSLGQRRRLRAGFSHPLHAPSDDGAADDHGDQSGDAAVPKTMPRASR
jgi:hypothetical protein